MERIVYRKTLDVHKNGIQFTFQGFETADNMTRTIEINLMASGDTIDLPLEQLVALMYVTTPNATEPSINECTIKDNTIIYDVLPIVEEGVTEMQLKLIDSRPEGANGVLASPKFAIEVSESGTNDDGAMQSTTYTALENALAMAKGVYDSRVVSVEIDSDCTFRVVYADGTTYESEVLKELYLKGESLLSQSYARGGTGIRVGEDTDNSMYYSNVSRSASAEATKSSEEAIGLLEETKLHGVYTAFSIDFESGEVKYISPAYKFKINQENGELEAIGKAYTPEETVELVVTEWLGKASGDIAKINSLAEKEYVDEELEKIKSGYVTKSEFSTFGVDTDERLESVEQDVNTLWSNAIEDAEHKGCYFRWRGNEREWINPPMESFVEYRTTERFLGKPVYTMTFGCLDWAEREELIQENGQLFIGNSPALVIDSNVMVYDHDEGSILQEDSSVFHDNGVPYLYVGELSEERDLYATFKYTKD